MRRNANHEYIPQRMEQTWQQDGPFLLLLLMGIAIVYGQVLAFKFVRWDDPVYVLRNPVKMGLTVAGIKQAFTSQVMTHWHPLTVMAHMLDVELFGLNPGAHHATNILVHAMNSLLLFSLLRSTTRVFWPSAFVAAAWALHPLHVENVAWVSDRKDLLCTFFGLLALHAYVRFVASRHLSWYALVLLLYCAGMLSKSMIVTLPAMCLLMDCWPLRHLGLGFLHEAGSGQNGSAVNAAILVWTQGSQQHFWLRRYRCLYWQWVSASLPMPQHSMQDSWSTMAGWALWRFWSTAPVHMGGTL